MSQSFTSGIVIMEEKERPGLGKWKYLFVIDAVIIAAIIGLLIYLKAIWFF